MQLGELLSAAGVEHGAKMDSGHPAWSQEVKGLSTNSQSCGSGELFLGMPGTRVDGGEFWAGAIASGAIAALISPSAAEKTKAAESDACIIAVPDMAIACANIAAAFYGNPGQSLRMVGVTGTNGKTTTTHLIEYLLTAGQQPTALLGTLYTRWPGYQKTAVHTTPFPVTLQSQLAEAKAANCQFGVMEVSSHALDQKRVLGCPFEVTVFTNLTQDHLDYHADLDDYFGAKAQLFTADYLKQGGRAIINYDDEFGQRLMRQVTSEYDADAIWTYSTQDANANLFTSELVYGVDGVKGILHTPAGNIPFQSPLVGQFNLENLLAAVGATLQLGLPLAQVVEAIARFPGVPGRMERVQIQDDQDIGVIVDYAHTPDSLENLLKAARPFVQGRMICVFGCGGDRDRTKRPQMGAIAARLSDWAIVTSDNPRTEDPEQILQDVVAGIPDSVDALVLADRGEAIRQAITNAKSGDAVLIAGKGHEDYQILGTEKIHFDDREQARDALTHRLQNRSTH